MSKHEMTCEHEDFLADVAVNRLSSVEGGPITGYAIEVRSWCAKCGEAVVFLGDDMPIGLLGYRPTVSMDRKELRLPVKMESDPVDFGRETPGFTVRIEHGPSEN